jgi:hypothetical protein
MASSAKTVAIILGLGQRFINLGHLAAVPGSDTIKESYSPLVRAVIQPLSITFDLMSLTRKVSQSFFDFQAPVFQSRCVGRFNIALHRSSLLRLKQIPSEEPNHQHGGFDGRAARAVRLDKRKLGIALRRMNHRNAKKVPQLADFVISILP